MIIDIDGEPSRDLATIDFSDITSVPVAEIHHDEEEGWSIEFASDLSSWEQRLVYLRANASETQQAIQDKIWKAVVANRNFLAVASPTNAQVLAQVKSLTRQIDALIKMTFEVYDDVNGL